MRFFVFLTLFMVGLSQAGSQVLPGDEGSSADDLGTLPDPQVEDVLPRGEEIAPIDKLFNELAEAKSDKAAGRIARKIQIHWLKSGSDTVDLLMERAAVALKGENYALALDLLDTVVVLKPGFAEGWNRRATIYYLQKDYGRSLVDVERTLALEPRHWGAMSGLAIMQRQLGLEDKALVTFRRALEIHPGLETAREAVDALEKDAEGDPV